LTPSCGYNSISENAREEDVGHLSGHLNKSTSFFVVIITTTATIA